MKRAVDTTVGKGKGFFSRGIEWEALTLEVTQPSSLQVSYDPATTHQLLQTFFN